MDVLSENGGTFTRTSQIPTRAGARTSYFTPSFGELFLAVPDRGGSPAELRIFTAEQARQ